ncbi:bifunctional 2-C-methyl-D-erythritol 4-phosphate cytidylyltransferase/2-C-methyl-D-erythritol 2,4-cyclodiphosphate synthase [Rhodoligotrophos appendicifer]|uniref:bifunctional 2-C-methyl-D-erythritol 4-phosphate cytidylyltransferase/2-C-methyl-D-erythritol 2,4-cyclodiphosphate synthase n=1 Tax=Rhodoligotrophos appendicifer TaxID=987056 RepID=UPI001FE29816|nr:bifunctional 2-C-methyl-D-erythritol 4-phosphate cytidylyltransferase/2-C-methyl-D-erythritol 2,4-cyclodiphosphate synthase [Rhodoligotrophos appendicifer]
MPKQFQQIGDLAVLHRTVRVFLDHPQIDKVHIVIGPDHGAVCSEILRSLDVQPFIIGSVTRQRSVHNGLQAIRELQPRNVLIHDGARPFVSADLISKVIDALEHNDAAIPAMRIAETVKLVHDGRVADTIDRTALWTAQTPQGFRFEAILDVHQKTTTSGRNDFTDDASMAEWAGLSVMVVDGERTNVKLTTAEDLADADRRLRMESWLAQGDIRVGQGFDVHQFGAGNHVTLCGVRIPHDSGLVGHSDADVALHALTDAIFGALGEGDIGVHFPPSDPQWKGASSALFLQAAAGKVAERGGVIAHCDITMVAEAPRIKPYVHAMKERLGELLGLTHDRLAIKATTNEEMGFIGRREGMVAYATATLRLPFR